VIFNICEEVCYAILLDNLDSRLTVKKKVSVLAPDLSGGGGTRVYLLAQVLQQLHYDVTVYGYLFGERLYPLPPANLRVEWVKGSHYPQFLGNIRALLARIDGDIVYAVKPRPTSLGTALLKRLSRRQPLILDIDDWEMSWFGGDEWAYRPSPKQLARDIGKKNGALRDPHHPVYLSWMERSIDRADAITVNTRFLQKRYGGIYLPNGKDTRLFDPGVYDPATCRAKYGLADYNVLMFPGTARPHKGLEDVLIALDLLDRPNFKLVVVGGRAIGDGYLERLLAQGKRWMIHLPSQSIDQMPEIVAAAHAIIVPQRDSSTATAQFPIKLTDAMAMAKPIISTKVGDIPEILEGSGYLVEPRSPDQLAEAIAQVFDHLDLANTRGQQSRERCITSYSTDAMAVILANLLDELL
jgi:glycosyltransferase involved in cell wall biosynthesis